MKNNQGSMSPFHGIVGYPDVPCEGEQLVRVSVGEE